MTVTEDERNEQALLLRETDPAAWERLHAAVRDLATIYEDIRNSQARKRGEAGWKPTGTETP